MSTMNKVVRIGRGEYGNVFCKIEISDKGGVKRLSISGVEGPMGNGNCKGSCGQIVDHLNVTEYAPGWDADKVKAFQDIWNAWHLNDMRAGCEHQRAEKWDERPIDATKPTNAYIKHPDGEHGWNMLTRLPVEHGGLLSAPCPVCGYKYGSQWLTEALPDSVEAFLESLPDTDIQPAWI